MIELVENYAALFKKEKLIEKILKEGKFIFYGVPSSAISLLLASLYKVSKKKQIVFIATTNSEAESFFHESASLLDSSEVSYFPGYEGIPYDYAHYNSENKIDRIRTLAKILSGEKKIIFTSVSGFLKTLPSSKTLLKNSLILKIGSEISQADLFYKLIQLGYLREEICQSYGSFSVKGGVVDIFSPSMNEPVRLDFFGDTLETVKLFDPSTQRSISEIEEISILPVSEFTLTDKEWNLYKEKIEVEDSKLKKPSFEISVKKPLEELISLVKEIGRAHV